MHFNEFLSASLISLFRAVKNITFALHCKAHKCQYKSYNIAGVDGTLKMVL